VKDLLIQDDIYVTGKGTILILSLEENQMKLEDFKKGEIIVYEDEHFMITGVEAMKKLFGTNVYQDKIGIIVRIINHG
jgi:hypothetical protein